MAVRAGITPKDSTKPEPPAQPRAACPAQPSLPGLDFIGLSCRSSLHSLVDVTQDSHFSIKLTRSSADRDLNHTFVRGHHRAKNPEASLTRAAPESPASSVPAFVHTPLANYASFRMASSQHVSHAPHARHVPHPCPPWRPAWRKRVVAAPRTWEFISMLLPSNFSALDAGDLWHSLPQRRPLVCF